MITHQHVKPRKPSRVVLLGARGFIGSAVYRQLRAQDIPVFAPPSVELNLTEAVAADKLALLLEPSDAVVMLATLTPDKGRDIATLMKNLVMMQSVCAALEKCGCAQLVYFSSDSVHNPLTSRVTEETPVSPQDLYGVMHYTREIMARSLTKLSVLVLRPTIVYGLDDTHNSYGPNRFRRTAQKEGKITLFGGGEEMRDHIYIDDVAALTVRCLLHCSTGTLNVATGISKPFHEVAEMVAKQFKNGIEIIKTPRTNPIIHRHYDVTDLIKAFPDFRFITLEEGVARVHESQFAAALP